MEQDLFQTTKNRQTVDPRIDIINKTTEPIYKKALDEFGFKLPLAFMLYNQVRFYEDYGKLNIGFNVASVETLADQFGVTTKQIQSAYNNLTNKYKLGKWVNNDEPIFRNVKRVWVSNERLKNNENYYSVIPELLQRNSKTITVEYLATDKPPLSESKRKVSESKNDTNVSLAKPHGKPEINELFDYWERTVGYKIPSKIKANRNACNNLINKHTVDGVKQLVRGVALSQNDQYAPRIVDYASLQQKIADLIVWGKKRSTKEMRGVKL